MDGEKEKKDKLAAARKKLNEYKLNRSGGGGGKSGPAVDSSKPADVPLFYQNINTSSPPVFNIFNPAALDNNNISAQTNQFYNAAPPTTQETEKVEVSPNLWEQPHQFSPQTDHQPQGNYGGTVPSGQPEEVLLTTTDVEAGVTSSAMLFQPVEQSGQSNIPIQADANIFEHDSSKETGYSLPVTDSFRQNYETVERTDEYKPSAPYESKADVKVEDMSASSVATNFSSPPMMLSKNEPLDISIEQVESVSMHRDSAEDPSTSTNVFASSLFSSTGSNELDNVFNIHESIQLTPNLQDSSMFSQNETGSPLKIDEISQVNPLIRPVQNLITPEMEECIDLVNSQTVKEKEREEKELDTKGFVSEQGLSHGENPVPPTIQSGELPDAHIEVQKSPDQTVSPTQDYQEILHTATDTSLPIRNEESYQLQENLLEDSQTTDISGNSEAFQRMKSVQEALDLQIEELRRENSHLLSRQTELTLKFEESEKLAHEFKLERDRLKEEATTMSQALRSRINSLCEENQRILKNSTEVGVDQRAKLEDKTRQLEEMQKAVIIVSQSKMDFAGRLDHELERVKELQNVVKGKDEEIQVLRTANSDLEEKLKLEQQKDAVIHQLEDQARHYKVQCETLLKELNYLRKRVATPEIHGGANSAKHASDPSHNHAELHEDHDHATHDHDHCDQLHSNVANNHMGEIASTHHPEIHQHQDQERVSEVGSAEHVHETGSSNQNSHSSDHWDHEGHNHEHHSHDHGHGHHEHHSHDHGHGHSHDHHHEEPLDHAPEVVARLGPSDEVSELKKTLHRLQWENSTFRNELDVLAVDAKQKKSYEEKCAALEAENDYLKDEVEKLEHVVIQLQGENDTIGDYVTLYQTQKMALKECAKEKDAQLELLAKEREILLSRLAELTNLVKDLRESKSESSSQCADDHIHSFEVPGTGGTNKRQLEGKIHDLLTEISSSSLIENFHPCAVCSGRLMTV